MKLHIKKDSSLSEDEIVIFCKEETVRIQSLKNSIEELLSGTNKFIALKDRHEVYLSLPDILFFETDDGMVFAHTKDNMFKTKEKLYELEESLPGYFMRISKSTICNTRLIRSIERNITASSTISFANTYKQTFVSRNYYKPLKQRLEEKRNL